MTHPVTVLILARYLLLVIINNVGGDKHESKQGV